MTFLSVYGHAILDTIIESPSVPDREEFIGISGFRERYGGTGANIAMAAARLGTPVSLASFVGMDFPEEYLDTMKSSGVDISYVIKKDGKSPRVWIVNSGDGQRGYVFQGVMGEMDGFELLYEPALDSEWAHFSTGSPSYYSKIAREARRAGKKIGFDPGQEIHYIYDADSLRKMLSLSDVFFCNESEMEKALSMLGLSAPDELLELVPAVINTKGEGGSSILCEEGERLVPALKPERFFDPTGAGDAYRAGFYTGQYLGFTIWESALIGSATASFVIENPGAQDFLPTLDMVRERLKKGAYEVEL